MIDDSNSIIRCTNKVYLAELLHGNGVPTPKTVIISSVKDLDPLEAQLSYPMVLKIPDGSFSRGVAKVADRAELERMVRGMLEDSDLILAQEFMYTDYDWRVGVLDGEPLVRLAVHDGPQALADRAPHRGRPAARGRLQDDGGGRGAARDRRHRRARGAADRARPLRRRHQGERARRVRDRGQRQPQPGPRRRGRGREATRSGAGWPAGSSSACSARSRSQSGSLVAKAG